MEFHSASFDAIGVTNRVVVTDPWVLDATLEIAREAVAALDLAASRFRDDSELSHLNRRGRLTVSPLLLDAVETALRAAEETDGLVDPTVGASLRGLGYDRDFDVLVSAGPRPGFELVPATGWRSVRVDRAARRIELRPGTELDLGATAKALAADRIARAARAATGADVLVSLGGDVAAAGAPPGGWPVHAGDDSRRAEGGQVVSIRGGGLATSSTTVRRWRAGGAVQHHIVDPRTGAPAPEVWRTVSVVAATCVDANVASTAAILLGARAPGWLETRNLHARLVRVDGEVVTVGGWPTSQGTHRRVQPASERAPRRSREMDDVDLTALSERDRGRAHVRRVTRWIAATATAGAAFLVAFLGLSHRSTAGAATTPPATTRHHAATRTQQQAPVQQQTTTEQEHEQQPTTTQQQAPAPAPAPAPTPAPAPAPSYSPPVVSSGGS